MIRPGVRRFFGLPLRTVDQVHTDADAELDAFLAERIEHLVRCGMTPDAARSEALRRLGAPMDDARIALRESASRREGRKRLHDVIREFVDDVRFAWRQCAKAPAFTTIAVLTLALSIGANTAIFSVVHRLLLAPLPFPNGNRIVMPMQEYRSVDWELAQAWQARTQTVTDIAGASEDLYSVRPDGTVDTLPSALITSNFLPMLGVRPAVGRGFMRAEELPDGQAVVAMISHSLWQRAYSARADILGQTVPLGGRLLTIVGVTPAGLSIPLARTPAPDVWVPGQMERAGAGGSGSLDRGPAIFAMLRPGVSAEAASMELQSVAASLPDSVQRQARVRVMRAQDFLTPRERRAVHVLFAAVGALLLIACANLANLLLARGWARQREFAIRGALGAGRARIGRQVLTESVSLALVGGLLGVGVAWLALRLIIALRPPTLDTLADVHLEPTVLLWTLGISVTTGILFGCVPALLAGAQSTGDVLRRETLGGSTGITARRVRSTLIVVEIAASLVLLVGSGLLVRSFAALQRMPLGFQPRGLVHATVLLGVPKYRDRKVEFRDAIIDRLRTLPGVTDVAIGVMPGKAYSVMGGLETEADSAGHSASVPLLGTVFISPNYFHVARIAVVDGRLPDPATMTADGKGRALAFSPEVLVNRELARRLWPNRSALGERVRVPPDRSSGGRVDPWSTVVGIVDDTRMPEVRGDLAAMQVYSLVPAKLGDMPILVRTAVSGDITAPMIKRAIASVHPALYVRPMLSGDTYLRDGLAPTRFAMTLITSFGVLALVLSAVGLYGVIAYSVSQRTREIGVRVALGAEPSAVIRLVVGGGLRLAGAGVVIGVALAVAATRLVESMLYGVSPRDPVAFGAVALLVAAVAIVASFVPARRALRIDPAETLRAD
ncbi:MAG: ADOP family duplicated permease [Gemmatimonadaceae bacterium]